MLNHPLVRPSGTSLWRVKEEKLMESPAGGKFAISGGCLVAQMVRALFVETEVGGSSPL